MRKKREGNFTKYTRLWSLIRCMKIIKKESQKLSFKRCLLFLLMWNRSTGELYRIVMIRYNRSLYSNLKFLAQWLQQHVLAKRLILAFWHPSGYR